LLPKDWSADFFSSAAVKYDEFYHIDSNYINNVIQPNFDEIRSILQDARSGDSNMKQEAFDKAFPKIVKLLNDMSIPFDDDVLTEYLMMHISVPKKKKKSTN
jgi:transposase-like protein